MMDILEIKPVAPKDVIEGEFYVLKSSPTNHDEILQAVIMPENCLDRYGNPAEGLGFYVGMTSDGPDCYWSVENWYSIHGPLRFRRVE